VPERIEPITEDRLRELLHLMESRGVAECLLDVGHEHAWVVAHFSPGTAEYLEETSTIHPHSRVKGVELDYSSWLDRLFGTPNIEVKYDVELKEGEGETIVEKVEKDEEEVV
jgi:hypothetical protein